MTETTASLQQPIDITVARQRIKQRDLEGAREACAFLREDGHRGPELDLVEGILCCLAGQAEGGIGLVRAAIGSEPDNTEWESDLGMGFLLMGEPERARLVLERATARPDADAAAFARLGTAQLALGNGEAAASALDEAIRRQPGRPEWHANLGFALAHQQRLHEAVEQFDRALQLNPDLEPAIQGRQRVLVALDEPDQAIAGLASQIRERPEDITARIRLAHALDHADRLDEAVQVLSEAAGGDPAAEVAALVALAGICIGRQMHETAYGALVTAEKLQPDNVDTLKLKAELLSQMGRQDGLDLINRAIDLAGPRPDLRFARAKVNSSMGHYREAESELRELVEIHPGDATLKIVLGEVLMWLGRFEEATEYLERAAQFDPAALVPLAQSQRLPDDPRLLTRLEEFAESPLVAPEPRMAILFGIAQAYEKKKDYDTAFEYAKRANEFIKKKVDYDHSDFTKEVDMLVSQFTVPFFWKKRDIRGSDSKRPVFVCGLPRSGTSLVEQILGSHPRIFAGGELPLVTKLALLVAKRLKQRYPECMEKFDQKMATLAADYYLENIDLLNSNAPFVVDKSPHNFMHLGLISLVFPNAKIIHVQRDPMDVGLSNYFQNFAARTGYMGYATDLEQIGQHVIDHDRLMAHWHEVLPLPILEVRYEDLIADQAGKTRELLDFVGVEWNDDVLSFHRTERPVATASVAQVRKPIYRSSVKKWHRYRAHLRPLEEVLRKGGAFQDLAGEAEADDSV